MSANGWKFGTFTNQTFGGFLNVVFLGFLSTCQKIEKHLWKNLFSIDFGGLWTVTNLCFGIGSNVGLSFASKTS